MKIRFNYAIALFYLGIALTWGSTSIKTEIKRSLSKKQLFTITYVYLTIEVDFSNDSNDINN
jgi:hypothetical protein